MGGEGQGGCARRVFLWKGQCWQAAEAATLDRSMLSRAKPHRTSLRLVVAISHQPNSSAKFISQIHQPNSSAKVFSKSLQQKSSAKFLSQSHQPKSSAKVLSQSHQPKPSAKAISQSHQPKPSAKFISRCAIGQMLGVIAIAESAVRSAKAIRSRNAIAASRNGKLKLALHRQDAREDG